MLETTSWRLIREAAAGTPRDRADFVSRYMTPVRAFLAARWRRSPLAASVEDAAQEVFLECFRDGGLLGKVDPDRPGGFRAVFFGVLRNVAARHEKRNHAARRRFAEGQPLEALPSHEPSPSTLLDRDWARSLMHAVTARLRERAQASGAAALRRCELLRLRFQDGLAIRDIAQRWQADAAVLHHEYATARKEFAAVLREVVAERAEPGDRTGLVRRLLDALG